MVYASIPTPPQEGASTQPGEDRLMQSNLFNKMPQPETHPFICLARNMMNSRLAEYAHGQSPAGGREAPMQALQGLMLIKKGCSSLLLEVRL